MDLSLCGAAEDDPEAVFDVMKSFPSGHAQMSSFTASFLIVRSLIKQLIINYLSSTGLHVQPSALNSQ